MNTKLKTILIVSAVIAGLYTLFWWDNRDLHAWYKTTVRQAQSEGFVPLDGVEMKSADIINPVSWFDPAPYQQWFISQTRIGSDYYRGKEYLAIRVVVYMKHSPYKDEIVIVYTPDRNSYAALTLKEAMNVRGSSKYDGLDYEKHNGDELHVAILKAIKQK